MKSKTEKPSVKRDAAARQNALRARSSAPPREPLEIALAEVSPASRDRRELKGVAIYLHPNAKSVLKSIARREHKSIQQLGEEAFDCLFLKYGEKTFS